MREILRRGIRNTAVFTSETEELADEAIASVTFNVSSSLDQGGGYEIRMRPGTRTPYGTPSTLITSARLGPGSSRHDILTAPLRNVFLRGSATTAPTAGSLIVVIMMAKTHL